MKNILLVIALCFLPLSARAAHVQSSKVDFATAASTACATGTVTSGNIEIMFVRANSSTSVTISSTRVTTWVLDQSIVGGSSHYLWHGKVTSSGAETVTVSFTSGTALIGSACLEYSSTTTLDATNGAASSTLTLTTVAAATTIVESGSSAIGATNPTSPYTPRQQICLTGTCYGSVGDRDVVAQGGYAAAFSGSSLASIEMVSLKVGTVAGVPRHR